MRIKNMFKSKAGIAIAVAVGLTTVFSAGAMADSAYKQITAYQNTAINITVNGKKVDLSSEEGIMYPLVYDGHSYVSARALAEAMGGTVNWNEDTQTVEVTTNGAAPGAAIPSKDNSGSTSKPQPQPSSAPSAPSKSSNAGTLSDPIAIGSSYTYKESITYREGYYDTYSSQYTVTVNSAKPISRDEIAALGFKKPEESATVDYMMLDLSLKVADAKFLKAGSDGSGYIFLDSFLPNIWGSKVSDGSAYIIGATDYGFTGSLRDAVDEACDLTKMYPGDSKSYQASGKVILPIVKGQTNYFVIKNDTTDMDYDKSMIYFKLK